MRGENLHLLSSTPVRSTFSTPCVWNIFQQLHATIPQMLKHFRHASDCVVVLVLFFFVQPGAWFSFLGWPTAPPKKLDFRRAEGAKQRKLGLGNFAWLASRPVLQQISQGGEFQLKPNQRALPHLKWITMFLAGPWFIRNCYWLGGGVDRKRGAKPKHFP